MWWYFSCIESLCARCGRLSVLSHNTLEELLMGNLGYSPSCRTKYIERKFERLLTLNAALIIQAISSHKWVEEWIYSEKVIHSQKESCPKIVFCIPDQLSDVMSTITRKAAVRFPSPSSFSIPLILEETDSCNEKDVN